MEACQYCLIMLGGKVNLEGIPSLWVFMKIVIVHAKLTDFRHSVTEE